MRGAAGLIVLPLAWLLTVAVPAQGQPVPQPFPTPGGSRPAPAPQQPTPPAQTPPPPATPPQPSAEPAAVADPGAPDEALLGVPIYPAARFIASYDAGRGQRYYIFGVSSPFASIVGYYRTVLKTRGTVVYDEPPVHIFEVGRFREQTMAFPPGVTVKDYTWGGSAGYVVPLAGGKSETYPTIVQIVPVPPEDRR
jgi:hypothetical protein